MERRKGTKLFHHLKKWLELAIMDHGMIKEGDRILLGVSGGADSLALLHLLTSPMVYVPPFSVLAVNIDMGFDPEYRDYSVLEAYMRDNHFEFLMVKTDIGPLSHSGYNRKNPCYLCSRLRRKKMFEIAEESKCTKIALAHHRDDVIETLLLNLFFGREVCTMMPNQSLFGGKLHVIRPLYYIPEVLLKTYAKEQGFPFRENRCPTSSISKRTIVKRFLNEFSREHRHVRENIFKALRHIKVDYLPSFVRDMK